MLLLLTVSYLLRRVFALPIPVIEYRSTSSSSCTDLNNCRTIWNIVWSCLVTTFACTWVAVHPNVPKPGQNANRRWYSRPLRRVRIMLYALIGPEFILFWAWRQWKVANEKPTLPQLRGMLRRKPGTKELRSRISSRLVTRAWILCGNGRFRRWHKTTLAQRY
jgi:hypothetical protein